MPIISVETVKTTDERQMQKITKEKQSVKGARGTEAIVKGWALTDFLVPLKTSLMLKVSL